MRLLVVGGHRVDAGKTTFSTGLLDRFGGVGFKPRAGNDFWFDHDDYRRAVADGRMYGKDAKRLAAASAPDLAPEDVNPIHRLWRPSPGPDTGLVGRAHREFVLDRVAESFVVNGRADCPDSARERLPLADAPTVSTVAELDDLTRRLHLPALEGFADRIRQTDDAVVESYGDVALPIRGVSFDAVAVVEPGRMAAYDGDRFRKACEVAGGTPREGQLEVHTPDVTDLATPKATVGLPALADAERSDSATVARAYGDAYVALLDVAEA